MLEAATSLAVGGGIDASGHAEWWNYPLQGNEIDLEGGANSVIAPGGNLILQPATPGQNIVWAGADVSGSKWQRDFRLHYGRF